MNYSADSLLLSDFSYELPDDRVARYPLTPRDSSRLLEYNKGKIRHFRFSELPDLIPSSSLLVFNDTKVIPARSHFQKDSGAVIEILFLHPEAPTRIINDAVLIRDSCVWECMIGNKKRWKNGESLHTTVVIDGHELPVQAAYADYEKNHVRLTWGTSHTFLDIIRSLGQIPLPPYLKRQTEAGDASSYQTVYAHHEGAVAAPTAGLHFTPEVLRSLKKKGVGQTFLTLHVGAGTFQPIKSETVTSHQMHAEQVVYSRPLLAQLRSSAGKIIPVGTTSMRSLESLYWYGVKLLKGEAAGFRIEKLYPYSAEENSLPAAGEALAAIEAHMDAHGLEEITGETEIFIFPGYRFRLCDGLVTNYHQPGSTLILLVAAFVGRHWKTIYREALAHDYRFLSYGDSSLLWREDP